MRLQIGAGLDGPTSWMNVDASPTLWLQRLPMVGVLLQRLLQPRFSAAVVPGDVVRGLRLPSGSVQAVYSSHVLEHLAFEDLELALVEIHRVLAPGGVFRSVLPDLACDVQRYLASAEGDRASAFMRSTLLGLERRERGLRNGIRAWLGNSRHLWMWDYQSMATRLSAAGFHEIRQAHFGDSLDPAFSDVEKPERWEDAFGFECRKPG